MATSECFQLILINAFWPNVIHVELRILHQRSTPQGNFTILQTEVTNLPTETGSGGGGIEPPTLPWRRAWLIFIHIIITSILHRANSNKVLAKFENC